MRCDAKAAVAFPACAYMKKAIKKRRIGAKASTKKKFNEEEGMSKPKSEKERERGLTSKIPNVQTL